MKEYETKSDQTTSLDATEKNKAKELGSDTEETIKKPFKVTLTGNHQVLVWDAKVATILRKDHKVVGSLIGNLPPNNKFGSSALGLPLALLPEETTVLLNEGVIKLKVCKQNNDDENGGSTNIPIWNWPQNECDKRKLQIYSDMRSKGYYLTSGLKFGGDYLAYPGEPMRYHSHFVITVVDWNSQIRPYDIVAMGRLGTTVKKTRLLSSVDPKDPTNVRHFSLNWAHLG